MFQRRATERTGNTYTLLDMLEILNITENIIVLENTFCYLFYAFIVKNIQYRKYFFVQHIIEFLLSKCKWQA